MNYMEEYKKWCESPEFDEETKKELLAIKNDEKEIEDRFYKELEFGTAGLRGIIGAGTNRMNKYTVGKATQGLANYILEQGTQEKGVAISYDSRKMSKEFALQTALILCANGIKAYLFENLRPVPELSFSVRNLGCTAGVMITASHNPPKYNGYKVYWDDGSQIVSPRDKEIISKVRAVEKYSEIREITKEEAEQKGLLKIVGTEMDDKYLDVLKNLVLNPDIMKEEGKELKVVYTPLHGTGNTIAGRLLTELGMKNVYVVKGELYLVIQDEMNGTVYASASFPFTGSATHKEAAIKSAIVNINYGKVQGFFKEAKEKILVYYRQQMDVVFHRAETCAKNGNYDEAIACLMMIPEELSDLHVRALQKAKEIYDQRDMAIRQREIAQRTADNDSILAEANSLIGMHNPLDALKTLWDYRPGTEQQDEQYAKLVKKAESLVSAAEAEALRKEERNYQDEKQKEVREWNEYTKETAHQRDMDRRKMQLKSQVAASAERVAHHRLDVDAQTVDALKTIACGYLRNKKIFVSH